MAFGIKKSKIADAKQNGGPDGVGPMIKIIVATLLILMFGLLSRAERAFQNSLSRSGMRRPISMRPSASSFVAEAAEGAGETMVCADKAASAAGAPAIAAAGRASAAGTPANAPRMERRLIALGKPVAASRRGGFGHC